MIRGSTSVKGVIQGLKSDNVSLLRGTVTQTGALKVQLADSEKIVLGGECLCVSSEFGKNTVKVTLDGEVKEMVLDNSLKTGDNVYLLRLADSKKYIVIGRV